MAGTNQKKQGERKSGLNLVVAAVTGTVVGAGVAVAGTVALKNEKNRERVKKVLTNIKKQATDYVGNMQKEAQDKKGEIEEKIAEGKEEIEKAAKTAKDSLNSN